MTNSIRVLFVCMGNICRSPAAEGVFRAYVGRADQDGDRAVAVEVDSAGTLAYHQGEAPDPRMAAAGWRRGYRFTSVARKVRRTDLDAFDLIVAMDHDNLRELERLAGGPHPRLRLLGTFLPGHEPGVNNAKVPAVPDPYYGAGDGFERVLDLLEAACPGLLHHCRSLTADNR